MIEDRKVAVPCRACDECKAHSKRRLLGRLIAEQQNCTEVWFSTFTYGGGYDNAKAYVLHYPDLQKTFKKLRKAGHKFKYLAVGEYGTEKGRAHWHVLFMWETTPPDIQTGKETRYQPGETGATSWEHGHVNHQKAKSQHAAAAYCMKYMDKHTVQGNQLKYSQFLGEKYLLEKAKEHARAGLPMFAQGNVYTVPESGQNARDGKPFYYPVEKDSALFDKMLHCWLQTWATERPHQRLAISETCHQYLEDVFQNLDAYSIQIQEFVAQHYGYQPVGKKPYVRKVVYQHPTEPNVAIIAHHAGYTVELYNNEGVRIWRADLGGEGLAQEPDQEMPKIIEQVDKLLLEDEPRLQKLRRANQHSDLMRRAS